MFPSSPCPECPCLHRAGHLGLVILGLFWDPKPGLSERQSLLAGSASQCCDFGLCIVPHCQKGQGTPVAAGLGLVSCPGKEEAEWALYL